MCGLLSLLLFNEGPIWVWAWLSLIVGCHQYFSNLLLGLAVEGTLFLRDLASVAHMLSVSATEAPGPGLSRLHIVKTLLFISHPLNTHLLIV